MAILAPRRWPRALRLFLIAATCLIATVALVLSPRIPLGPGYHDFADQRTFWDIPNAWDVLSNLPFLVTGIWGTAWLLTPSSRTAFLDQRERRPFLIFFAGVALTGVGSLWYHLAPSNSRLPWDLLPMTCSFMSMVAIAYIERIDIKTGLLGLAPLLLLGIFSVFYWYISEAYGRGDYKFYLFVQFFSPVVLALIVLLFAPRYTGMRYLLLAFGLFVAAKIFEVFDFQVFGAGHVVSGHSLKHAIAGVACYFILRMLQVRRAIFEGHPESKSIAPPDQQKLTLSGC